MKAVRSLRCGNAASGEAPDAQRAKLRVDLFLWFSRLARSRAAARAMAESGHARIDGRRIERAHAPVRIGQVLTLAMGNGVQVVRIEHLPLRRGPASEARLCYRPMRAPGSNPDRSTIATGVCFSESGGD